MTTRQPPRHLAALFLVALLGVLLVVGLVVSALGGALAVAAYSVVVVAGLVVARLRLRPPAPAPSACSCCAGGHDGALPTIEVR